MKKIVFCLMATILSLTFIPVQLHAANEPSSLETPKPAAPADSKEAETLVLRLNEIKAMDMENLKSSEKKNLRKEVKSINHKLRETGGVVYLSAGTIILILILLIVLL